MGMVNSKKCIRLKNRTKYFDPSKDRSHVVFSSPLSYQSRKIKIEGYETRLYWQFRYCQEHSGQTFYYTLTYNDLHCPKHYGVSCFDYEDLRDLLTGGFRKMLLRKYGTRFKYFISAELGDGKGERGFHNNPHYHVLFFLEPANDKRYRYRVISPLDFRFLVRKYWQGFDESREGFRSYRTALYGIAREGENLGLVTDFRACVYVAKYVCKDVQLKMHEEKVESFLRFKYRSEFRTNVEVYKGFLRDVLFPLYNTPLNVDKTVWLYDDNSFIDYMLPDYHQFYRDVFGKIPSEVYSYTLDVPAVCSKFHLWNKFYDYLNEYIDGKVKLGINEWRNRFCNKCRISHGVGDYALNFVNDADLTVQVPSKKGFKSRPLSLYYYRKKFTSVVTPCSFVSFGKRKGECVRYPVVRVLNDDGIKYKVSKLEDKVKKMADRTKCFYQLVLSNSSLFDSMFRSDVNSDFFLPFEYVCKLEVKPQTFINYAYYKLVYEDRFFKLEDDGFGSYVFPSLNPVKDYERFCRSSVGYVARSDLFLDSFLDSNCEGYLPYRLHPDFLRDSVLYGLFDLCTDYFFVQNDNEVQKQAEFIASVRRLHVKQKLLNQNVINVL